MKQILVYADRGVDGLGLKQTVKSLQSELDPNHYSILRLDAHQIKKGGWEKSAALVVIPGGQDIYYDAALGEEGSCLIKDYVLQGGSYLGLCAGAYFACDEFEFEKGGKLEVCAKRSLGFYPGLAVGPAYGLNKYSYENGRGAEAALLSWDRTSVFSYFNGGCQFEFPERYTNISVLSRYLHLKDTPAAVVHCRVGEGKAILSGAHIEYSTQYLSDTDAYIRRIYPDLASTEEERRGVFREVLYRLGLALKK